ncbi:hypothetical protein M747DRAFT_12040 [Aspergillus niger ATCC 13496]|uniref:Uncharacterized protein n=1 Tax=Aspergillus niger ATCC 13496 TaxID=1353008 RepID=A0A370C8W5_ASPNG|nr:hypothetical protein M747DRAFT_12040 [Aspergillus niger ATCC 13496]
MRGLIFFLLFLFLLPPGFPTCCYYYVAWPDITTPRFLIYICLHYTRLFSRQ